LVKHGEDFLLALKHKASTIHHFVLEVTEASSMASQQLTQRLLAE
jgi:hypothetical protein